MATNPPGSDSSSDGSELRRLRWTLSAPESARVRSEPSDERTLPVNRYVLAVERWAIAIRRAEAGVASEEELAVLAAHPELVAWLTRIPSRIPSRWVRWLQRIVRWRPDHRETPPEPQPPMTA